MCAVQRRCLRVGAKPFLCNTGCPVSHSTSIQTQFCFKELYTLCIHDETHYTILQWRHLRKISVLLICAIESCSLIWRLVQTWMRRHFSSITDYPEHLCAKYFKNWREKVILASKLNRGAVVAVMDLPKMRGFFQTAPIVHAAIARLAAERASPDQIYGLKEVQKNSYLRAWPPTTQRSRF